jgi:predicted ATPase with chaperone activity
VIKVARTIADLDGEEVISQAEIAEALCCRCPDRSVMDRYSPVL